MLSPRVAETRPSSGGSCPVITWSSVVLPSPLRPTMPTRSPTEMPSETSVSSGRTPYALETRSRLTRLLMRGPRGVVRRRSAAGETKNAVGCFSCRDQVGAGDRPVRDEYDALVACRGQHPRDAARVVGRLAEEHA